MLTVISNKINSIEINDFSKYNDSIKELNAIETQIESTQDAKYLEGTSSLKSKSKNDLLAVVKNKKTELRNKFFKKVEIEFINKLNNNVCSLDIYDKRIEYFRFDINGENVPLGTYQSYDYKNESHNNDRDAHSTDPITYYYILTFSKGRVSERESEMISIFVRSETIVSPQEKNRYELYSSYSDILKTKKELKLLNDSSNRAKEEKKENDKSDIVNLQTKIAGLSKEIDSLNEKINQKKQSIDSLNEMINQKKQSIKDKEDNDKERAEQIEKVQIKLDKNNIPAEILKYDGDDELLKKIKNNGVLSDYEERIINNASELLKLFTQLQPKAGQKGGRKYRNKTKTIRRRRSKKSKKTHHNRKR